MSPFMKTDLRSPIGLVAGNGQFPIEFAKSARAEGFTVVAIAHKGETDPALEALVDKCLWVRVGQLGKMLRFFRGAGVSHVSFAGGISRVKLFGGVRPDWTGMRFLARQRSFRDDALLRAIAQEFERRGIAVFSASLLLEKCTPRAGVLTARALTAAERADARLGWEIAKEIGRLDIGQTVVVAQGLIVAVEGVEGTDAAIERGGNLARSGAVIVKTVKPQQDLRLDLPAIGRHTILAMERVKASALIIEAGKSIMLDPDEVVRAANAAGIAIFAASSVSDFA